MIINFPYGRSSIAHDFETPPGAVLTSAIAEYRPECDGETLVRNAMAEPIGSKRLSELARGKKNIVIIASDHTRPVPSKVIIPPMLEEIAEAAPDAAVTVLIATGCHRGTTEAELRDKFGEDILRRLRIVVHDCDDRDNLVSIGTLPSGGDCEINRLAVDADLLIAEGFIEPHFFAGFSGGRKSVLPGVAGRFSVLANHCAEFIDHPRARTGSLEGNPIHEDMLWAAKTAGLAYVVNVVLSEDKEVIYAVAGDAEAAHLRGVEFLQSLCSTTAEESDIVITTNGGYPLDQNVYQAVKGMTAAEAAVREGGVIIMLAESGDGIGGEHFYHQLADEADIERTLALFRSRGRSETLPDQWQTQIMLRVLSRATVIYISEIPDEDVRQLHMIPAHSIGEALAEAKRIIGREDATITVIPDGVSVIVSPRRR